MGIFIDVPDRCDPERLADRVQQLPLSRKEQLTAWKEFYLGNDTEELGNAMRTHFLVEVCEEYWRDRFAGYHVDSYGFSLRIREYLSLGFDLEKLCSLVIYEDKYGRPRYELFIKSVMDTRIYIEDKDCSALWESTRSTSSLMEWSTSFPSLCLAAPATKR